MTSRASHSGIGIRHVESASGLLQRRISAPNSAVSRYGALQRTHSQKSLESVGSDSSLSRVDSFQDLPHYALPGIGSRVSIRGSTSAASDLDQLFRHGLSDDVPWVQHEGGWTFPLIMSTAGALLSALQFGINNGNMNTQAQVMRQALGIPALPPAECPQTPFPTNDALWGFCISCFCLSALLGSAVSGKFADRYGRRSFLLLNSLLYVMASFVEFASSWPECTNPNKRPASEFCSPEVCSPAVNLLLIGRLLTGVACGGSTVVVPMYLGEIAPAHLRGSLGSAFLLTAVSGMLLGQVVGLPSVWGTPIMWPYILLFVSVPAFFQLTLLQPFLLESPRWLLMIGSQYNARRNLAMLRGCDPDEPPEELLGELDDMQPRRREISDTSRALLGLRKPMLDKDSLSEGPSALELLANRNLRKPLFICVTLMMMQQFSGINNAFNYSSIFLSSNGVSDSIVTLSAIAMNVGNVLVVLLSTVLMDSLGRRPLLLMSFGIMAFSSFLLTVGLISLSVPILFVSIVLFVMSFGLGLGPVIWLLPAELFPMTHRAAATGAVTAANWLANFVVGQVFLLIAVMLGPFSFVPFGVLLVLGFVFAWYNVPETRGKTLEQIEREMRART